MSDWLEKFLGLMDGVVDAAKLPALKGGGAFDGGALVWHWHWEEDNRRGQLLLQARPDSYGERINIVLTASAWPRSRNDVLWTWAYDPPSSLSTKAADPSLPKRRDSRTSSRLVLSGSLLRLGRMRRLILRASMSLKGSRMPPSRSGKTAALRSAEPI